ncbi:hypothetical protein ACPB8P_31995 [Streptomyces cellulosae]
MNERLPLTRIAEIEQRAEAATPGPWLVEMEQCDCSDGLCGHGTYASAVYANEERRNEFEDFTDSDWLFIIHAREDVPALLSELFTVRAELRVARGRVAELETAADQLSFIERNTLTELHRRIEHHMDGKARWRKRAEAAEARVAELAALRAERDESQRYAALLEVELCQCEPLLETGEYMHEATCPVVEIQMRTLGCPGFEGNPVAPDLCAGCHEPRENHASASQDGVS